MRRRPLLLLLALVPATLGMATLAVVWHATGSQGEGFEPLPLLIEEPAAEPAQTPAASPEERPRVMLPMQESVEASSQPATLESAPGEPQAPAAQPAGPVEHEVGESVGPPRFASLPTSGPALDARARGNSGGSVRIASAGGAGGTNQAKASSASTDASGESAPSGGTPAVPGSETWGDTSAATSASGSGPSVPGQETTGSTVADDRSSHDQSDNSGGEGSNGSGGGPAAAPNGGQHPPADGDGDRANETQRHGAAPQVPEPDPSVEPAVDTKPAGDTPPHGSAPQVPGVSEEEAPAGGIPTIEETTEQTVVQVPEPATLGLMALGLLGFAAGRRRR